MTHLLAGRRGLILGLSGPDSIGHSCLTRFRDLGAEVAITYRPSRAAQCAPLADKAGASFHLGLDAASESSMTAAFTALSQHWDRLDFVVHTWAYVPPGLLGKRLFDVSKDDFHDVLEVGARSLLTATALAQPLLLRSPTPRVVALTSPAFEQMMPTYHVMGIAKAALVASMRYLAMELGPDGVLCNAVSFSLLPTGGANRAVGAENAAKTHSHLAKRAATRSPLQERDVTGAIAYLASDLCGNTTGEVLTVDGGYSRMYF